MPIIQSAKKRVKVATKAAVRNSKTKRSLRTALKAFETSLEGKNSAAVSKTYSEAQAAIDTAVKKNIIHKNKAAREKARLAQKMKDAGVKPSTKKAPAKNPAAKKPATKTAAKKPAAKKTTKK